MSEQTSTAYYMFNTEILEASTFAERCKPTVPSLYEVIRVMDGIPLFLEEHYKRLINSADTIHQQIDFSLDELKDHIHLLTEKCHVQNQNIKLVLYDFLDGHPDNYCLYFIPTHYPEAEHYITGVDTDLFHAVRNNPQAKIINQSLRDASNAYIAEHNLYEVLLVNDNDEITEGSRSNLFFIKGSELFTSPFHGVLPGITMQRIMRVCEENGISVKQTPIPVADLKSYEAAFISGTSPKVLPIRSIGTVSMQTDHPTLRTVMDLYEGEIRNYLLRNFI